jgi:His-Xaa-Ser system radical SAM maturase HxsB
MIVLLARDIYREENLVKSGFEGVAAMGGNWLLEIDHANQQRERLNEILSYSAKRLNMPGILCKLPSTAPIQLPAVNYYRYDKLSAGTWLLTSDSGRWLLLPEEEFQCFRSGIIGDELAKKLASSHILLNEDNIDSYISILRNRLGFLVEGPTLHILVVTTRCNLRCAYCQASSSMGEGTHMESRTARAAVDRIFESPSPSVIIEFQGGEPLLNFPIIREIIEYSQEKARIKGLKVEYSLISNFSNSVTYDKIAYLLKYNVSIAFSLDGPEELHNRNRGAGYKNVFSNLRNNVELFRRVWRDIRGGDASIHALMTTTRASLPLFREIIDSYLKMGINQISVRPLTLLGGACQMQDEIGYSPDEFLEFWKECITYIIELRRSLVDINEFHLELILTKLFGNETGYMDWRSPCGACYGQIVYNHDGSIFACDEGRMVLGDRFRVGDCLTQSLSESLVADRAVEISDSSILEQYLCDYCAYKPFCGICPVLNFSEYGRVAMNVLETRRCKIRKGMISHVLALFMNDKEVREEFEKILLEVEWQK